jgi:hypothetical protein
MNQKEDDFAHLWIVAKRGQNDEFWLNLAIRHPQLGSAGVAKLENHLKRTMLQGGTSSLIVPSPSNIGPPGEPAQPGSSQGGESK